MKKIYQLILVFSIFANSFAQQTYALKDNRNEVAGYAELVNINGKNDYYATVAGYEFRPKDVKVVFQDINLNTINDVLLKFDVPVAHIGVYYNKNSVLIIARDAKNRITIDGMRYFIYDLKTNTLSAMQKFPAITIPGDVLGQIISVDGQGFIFQINNLKNKENISMYAMDNSGKKLWKEQISTNSGGKAKDFFTTMHQIEGNLLGVCYGDEEKSNIVKFSVMLINTTTGKEISRMKLDDEKNRYDPKTMLFKNDKLYVFGDLYAAGKKFEEDPMGFFMIEYDRTGKEIIRKNLPFSNLRSSLNIDKDGEVKSKGFIYTHEFLITEDAENILLVGEYFKKMTVNDLVFLKFDKNFDFISSFEIKKVSNKAELPYNSGGSKNLGGILKIYNYFDYEFSEKLDKNKGFGFFYKNITNDGTFVKTDYNFGIVSYQNETFKGETIKFDSKKPMDLLPSKPGYFLLFDYGDKNEMINKRIEKVNY